LYPAGKKLLVQNQKKMSIKALIEKISKITGMVCRKKAFSSKNIISSKIKKSGKKIFLLFSFIR
jgi:hypothetical protein